MLLTTGNLMVRSLMSAAWMGESAPAASAPANASDRSNCLDTDIRMTCAPLAWTRAAIDGPGRARSSIENPLPRRFPLIGHRRHCGADSRVVAKVVVLERPQPRVELVDKRLAGRDVETHDILVRDIVEVLHKRPQAV